jgi:RHS repeat-associated protein
LPIQMNDMYSYTAYTAAGAGLPSAKRLQVNQLVYTGTGHVAETANLDSTYTYNNEGKLTAITYPSTDNGSGTSVPGASYNYSYDSMYRLSGMTTSGGTTVVNGVSYNAANQLLGMTYNGIGETRGYNVLNQLTSIVAGGTENLTYTYPAGPNNNGKITSMYNAVSGETVTYTYDSLTRLATAAGSGWGEAYTFDGFGNLTTKHVTAGSGPSLSVSVNPANNQIEGLGGYDLNGNAYLANVAYDVENHIYALVGESPYTSYSYDAQGKRIFLWGGTSDSNGNPTSYSVVAYSPTGQKLGTYLFNPGTGHTTYIIAVSVATSDQYFGGRRLAVQDQLGSAGTYFPWGEAKGTTNPQDTWSYATYWRDSATGLDYANNRFYSNAYGRFMTPDPYGGSAKPANPETWNRYAYGWDDPVNDFDPNGLDPPHKGPTGCAGMLADINRLVYGKDSDSLRPTSGIFVRYMEQIYGAIPPGTGGWDLHNDIIAKMQKNLKKLMEKFIDDKCPPPANWKDINKWVNMPLPTQQDYKGPPTQFYLPMVPLPVIEDILELLPLFAFVDPGAATQVDSIITSSDEIITYDMSPYLDDLSNPAESDGF